MTVEIPFVCPICRNDLANGADGMLRCVAGAHSFDRIDGMPVLLRDAVHADATQRSFARQWALQAGGAYEADTIYGETAEDELRSFLDRFAIEGPEQLAGKRILDAGCGSGRLTRNLGRWAPRALVAGGDRSDAARLAHRRCSDVATVRIAQFDLHEPPFAFETFDYVYADGVVPHVPDADAALAALDRLVAPGGKLFVWIYPRGF